MGVAFENLTNNVADLGLLVNIYRGLVFQTRDMSGGSSWKIHTLTIKAHRRKLNTLYDV